MRIDAHTKIDLVKYIEFYAELLDAATKMGELPSNGGLVISSFASFYFFNKIKEMEKRMAISLVRQWGLCFGSKGETCQAKMKSHHYGEIVFLKNMTLQLCCVYGENSHYEIDLDSNSIDWLDHIAHKTWSSVEMLTGIKAAVDIIIESGEVPHNRIETLRVCYSYDNLEKALSHVFARQRK